MIDWTKADDREWMYERFAADWHDVTRGPANDASSRYSVVDTLTEIDANEIVTMHNYRLAKSRRKTWTLDEFSDGSGWGIWTFGNDGEFIKTICGPVSTELEAMAEFVRLDKEMPR